MSARRVLALLIAGLALVAFAMWIASQRHLERATLAGTWCCRTSSITSMP